MSASETAPPPRSGDRHVIDGSKANAEAVNVDALEREKASKAEAAKAAVAPVKAKTASEKGE